MSPDEHAADSIRRDYPAVLTTEDVCALLRVSPRTVLNMASDGRLQNRRIPGTRKNLFLREDVIALMFSSADDAVRVARD